MTKQETQGFVEQLQLVFDLVRLVNVSSNTQYTFDENGELTAHPYYCYAVWNKKGRCENCISAKAFSAQTQLSKFEFVNDDIYFIISKYIEVDNVPYTLEMVTKLSEDSTFDAYGRNQFIDAITGYNEKLYIDALTETYNRRYYEEQLSKLLGFQGMAMVDVDNFKQINDSFGHPAGDAALRMIAKILLSSVRGSDAVIRYGGDEFMILFQDISREIFAERLNSICKSVKEQVLNEYPDLKLSVSIGGAYRSSPEEDLLHLADDQLYIAKNTKGIACFV